MAGLGRLQLVNFYGEPVDEITGVLPILALGGRLNLEGLEDHLQDDSDPRTQLIQVSRDGKVLAGGRDTLLIWDGETGKLVREIPLEILEPTGRTVEGTVTGTAENTASITVLTLDGAGRTVALGLSTGEIQIYEVDTGTLVTHIAPSRVPGSAPASALTFSRDGPDGRRLAAGFEDGTVCLFETRSGITAERRIEKESESQSEDRSLETTPSQLRSYKATGRVRDLDFSPDGRTLAIMALAIAARELLLWDLESEAPPRRLSTGFLDGRVVNILDFLYRIGGRIGGPIGTGSLPVQSVRFSPNGNTLTAIQGSTLLVWQTPFYGSPKRLIGHQTAVSFVTFSSDGSRLHSFSGGERKVRIWRVAEYRDARAGATGATWSYTFKR